MLDGTLHADEGDVILNVTQVWTLRATVMTRSARYTHWKKKCHRYYGSSQPLRSDFIYNTLCVMELIPVTNNRSKNLCLSIFVIGLNLTKY